MVGFCSNQARAWATHSKVERLNCVGWVLITYSLTVSALNCTCTICCSCILCAYMPLAWDHVPSNTMRADGLSWWPTGTGGRDLTSTAKRIEHQLAETYTGVGSGYSKSDWGQSCTYQFFPGTGELSPVPSLHPEVICFCSKQGIWSLLAHT